MDTRAQSETVGAILLVGLVVVSVSAVGYATVQRGTATDDAPSVSVSVRVTNASVTLVHDGGDAVRTADLAVVVREDGADRGLTWAGGSLDGNGDDRFGPGEEWTAGVALDPDATVRVLLIDRATETVLADRTVEPTVSADPAGLNAPPDPGFTYSPAAPTGGDRVTFTATGTDPDGTITGRTWLVDGTVAGSGATFERTFAAGSYEVALTATDDGGATATTRETVAVGGGNEAPTAAFDADPTEVNVGETVGFDAGGSFDPDGSIASYGWTFGDGNASTGETTSHAYGATGEYLLTLTVTDDEGATASDTETVAVTPPYDDPGGAFTDVDGDRQFDPADGDRVVDLSDGDHDNASAGLVVPDSVGFEGVGKLTLKAREITVRTTVDNGGSLKATATAGDVDLTDATVTPDDSITLKAAETVVVDGATVAATGGGDTIGVTGDVKGTDATVRAATKVTAGESGAAVALDGATVETTEGGSTVKLTGDVTAPDATIRSRSTVTVGESGGSVDIDGATVETREGGSTVLLKGDLSASNAEIEAAATVTAGTSGATLTLDGATVETTEGGSTVKLTGDVTAPDATIRSGSTVTVGENGGSVGLDRATVEATGGGSTVKLTGSVDATDATIDSGRSVTVGDGSGTVTLDRATVSAVDDGSVTVRATTVEAAVATIERGQIDLKADAGGMDLGLATLDTRSGYQSIALSATGDLNLSDALLRTGGSMSGTVNAANRQFTVTDAAFEDANGDGAEFDYSPQGAKVVGCPKTGSVVGPNGQAACKGGHNRKGKGKGKDG